MKFQPANRLPDFVIIGAMKCGTTSLHEYLNLHPEIGMSQVKELNFFIEKKNWGQGIEWYKQQFPAGFRLVGEASPNYSKHSEVEWTVERMYDVIPNAKLIYIVREPVARIVSHFVHGWKMGNIRGDIETAVRGDLASEFISGSSYGTQLERYLKCFSRDQILLLTTRQLMEERVATLQQIFAFLGADPSFENPGFEVRHHLTERKLTPTPLGHKINRLPLGETFAVRTRKLLPGLFLQPVQKPRLREETIAMLKDQLKPEVERFEEISGLDVSHWNFK